eukprot:2914010-Prymnesium_polylepis.4
MWPQDDSTLQTVRRSKYLDTHKYTCIEVHICVSIYACTDLMSVSVVYRHRDGTGPGAYILHMRYAMADGS